MAIDKAFCIALRRVVTAKEAVDAFHNGQIRKQFFFACADEACRVGSSARIKCVCCYSAECGKLAHFANFPETTHSPDCLFNLYGQAILDVRKNRRKYPHWRKMNLLASYTTPNLDPELVVDVLTPNKNVTYMDKIRKMATTLQRQHKLSRKEAVYKAPAYVARNVNTLEDVVVFYESLNSADRESTRLKIPGRRRTTYEKAFRTIYGMREHYATPYIIHATARVISHAAGFGVYFSSYIRNYSIEGEILRAVCFFSHDDLALSCYGEYLLNKLQSQADLCKKDKEHKCRIYILGNHSRRNGIFPREPEKFSVVIEPNSLELVAIRNL